MRALAATLLAVALIAVSTSCQRSSADDCHPIILRPGPQAAASCLLSYSFQGISFMFPRGCVEPDLLGENIAEAPDAHARVIDNVRWQEALADRRNPGAPVVDGQCEWELAIGSVTEDRAEQIREEVTRPDPAASPTES